MSEKKTMRDALLARLLEQMSEDETLFFLSADMGAPALDEIRRRYPERFFNVGIAEQNLIGVAAGLAMEGCTVYTLAIASFYLRAYEQIRNNLSIAARFRTLNVNLLAVGSGISYDVTGPSHHALEELTTMRSLPDVAVVSLADWRCAARFPDYARRHPHPKYVRLDGKPHAPVAGLDATHWQQGFQSLRSGGRVALITTGFMTRKGARIVEELKDDSVGLVDVFQLTRELDETALGETLSRYDRWVTLQEGYVGRGGLDTLIDTLWHRQGRHRQGMSGSVTHLGFPLQHQFTFADRERLQEIHGMGDKDVRRHLTMG